MGAAQYYADLAREDYYLNGGEPPGQWWCKGAVALGLEGKVDAKEFHNLFNGFSPDGSRALVQNAGQTDGYHKRSPAHDLTFSAPKSVSTYLSQAPRDIREIGQAAHNRAVRFAMSCAEELVGVSRRGKGGKFWEKADLTAAIFEHGTSRAEEPQIHSHAIVFRIGIRQDGTTGSLVTKGFYDYQFALGALYRCELSRLLEKDLGLRLERVESWFEIADVSQKLQETFSTRRKEILEFGKANGFEGAKAAEFAALETRQVKGHVARSVLQLRWRKIGREMGWSEKEALGLLHRSEERDLGKERERVIRDATEELGNSKQFVTKADVIEAVARHTQASGLGGKEVLEMVEDLIKSQQLQSQGTVKHHEVFTTAEAVKEQQEIISLVERANGKAESAASKKKPKQRSRASTNDKAEDTQSSDENESKIKSRVEKLTRGPGVVHGATDLSEADRLKVLLQAKELWRRAGFYVYELLGRRFPKIIWESKTFGVSFEADENYLFPNAPAWSAAADWKTPRFTIVLEQHPHFGPIKARVENRFFAIEVRDKYPFADAPKINPLRSWTAPVPALVLRINDDPFGLRKGVVIILDEASKVAAHKIKELVKAAIAAGAKLILTDRRQVVPSSGLLSQIEGRNDQAKKLTPFGIGETHPKAFGSMVDDWKRKGIRNPQANVMLTTTRDAAHIFNLMAQQERRLAGYLGRDSLQVEGVRIHRKDRVRFTENSDTLGVGLGDAGTVTRVSGSKLHVFLDDGRRVIVPTESFKAVELGYAFTHVEASRLNPKRAFVLFEGFNAEIELAEIHRREASSRVRVYSEVDQAQRGLGSIQESQRHDTSEKSKPRFESEEQKRAAHDEHHTH